mgnify:CR=1 FL=1
MAADITIQLQDGYKVKIHSIVLAASSKFFNEFAEVNSALLKFLMFISIVQLFCRVTIHCSIKMHNSQGNETLATLIFAGFSNH